MKEVFRIIMLTLFIISVAHTQGFRDIYTYPEQSQMAGGLGITWIDDQPYTTITLAPEFALGKVGIGIFLQFLMDNQNNFKLREDEFKDGAGILRAIRYVRYGHKYDPFYARAGTLEMASLANGFLMWNYTNASNYDKRKWGLAFDIDFGKFGFESVTSNLVNFEIAGGNLYFRPVRFLNPDIPILKNLRLYATYVYENKYPSWKERGETENIEAYGVGTDLIFLDTPLLKSGVYYDYGQLRNFGHGQATGINAVVPEIFGLMALSAKFEKRWLGKQFIANFFGPFYDLDRELNPFEYPESKINLLQSAEEHEGYFGELAGHIINRITLRGNYQRLNGVKGSGIIHVEALAPNLVPKFELRGWYDKRGIETFKDFRTLDNRSLLAAQVGYRLNFFLVVSTTYYWYWVKEVNESGETVYRPLERVEPRLSFSFQF
ncbi:MAG: hypothetical protein EH225_03325 [Calditrichaeota bacterium]|nr:hypothetical protein [Calditrichota bacterium]RQV93514.1 MAG: hypothetical protein EH221_09445 [bacterium]RQW06428.1 MAG: hypothetical protein EH225_03325 [Calditrichota bacterium]